MRVILLGTSSGKPTLKRNVSALAMTRDDEWLLFDCGEATQHQIMRTALRTSRLSAVFITHLHGDHFNGLPGLISTMGLDGRERALVIVGPPGIREYVDTLSRLKTAYVNYPLEIREIEPKRFREDGEEESGGWKARSVKPRRPLPVYETEKYAVSAAPLDHRIYDLGYRVDERPRPGEFNVERALALGVERGPMFGRLQSGKRVHLPNGKIVEPRDVLGPERAGKSIAYCTDTRPCAESVALSDNVDLLIHEATYTSELAEEAVRYGHSTALQAASVAKQAGARRLVITHFSSRYMTAEPLLREARSVFENTEAGEDLLEIEP